MTIYKVPMTLTVNCIAIIEAGSPDGALTDIKTMLDFNGSEFEDCEGLLFDSDHGVEITEATQVGQPSFGAVIEAEDQDGDGTEEEPADDEKEDNSAPETSGEATPPTDRDLK